MSISRLDELMNGLHEKPCEVDQHAIEQKLKAMRKPATVAVPKIRDGKDGAPGAQGESGAQGASGVDGKAGAAGAQGVSGINGVAGADGAVGAQGDKGDAGMVWRGTYRNDTQYDIGDVVGVSGSAYVCVAATNQAPPTGFGWELLVSRGLTGARGIKGDDGGGGAAAAGTLTGATLAANVIASSLTSVGTLAALSVTATIAGSINGNAATATTATTAGTVTTAAQPTITSVGTLTAVNTSGVITGTNTTASTSSTTGAVIIAGGAGFAKDLNIAGASVGIGDSTRGLRFGVDTHTVIDSAAEDCIAIGHSAGKANTVGLGNVAIGSQALFFMEDGGYNNAQGSFALYSCVSGSNNVAIGNSALFSTTAEENTGIGAGAGFYIETGDSNVVIGANAANQFGVSNLTNAASGIYIGAACKAGSNTDTNAVVIGASALGLGANTTVIGTTSTTATRIFGVHSTGQVAPTIASAATIAPTKPITFISGTTSINTITAPTGITTRGGQITLIPTGIFTTTTAGNIALATTAVVSRALIMSYDATTAKWYPTY